MTDKPIQTLAPGKLSVMRDESSLGVLDPDRFDQMFRVAQAMASATLIPDHLWKNKAGNIPHDQVVGNCFLIVNQASRWGMDPFAVAPETYSARGKLGFQGKLVAAVVNSRAGLKERLRYDFSGSGDDLTVTVYGTFIGEDSPRTVKLSVGDAKTDNTIWTKDPEQKLIYSGATKWARRHCPEVILGVMTDDDLERIESSQKIDYNDPKAREMQVWQMDCETTKKYNEDLKARGYGEEMMEPMPEKPVFDEPDSSKESPEPEQVEKTPWRDVEIRHFRGISGKKVGTLDLPKLIKLRDVINGMSAATRAGKEGLDVILVAVLDGIKELQPTEEPKKATPQEALSNLMKASGVSEVRVVELVDEVFEDKYVNIQSMPDHLVAAVVSGWSDYLGFLKSKNEAKDASKA